MAPHSLADRYAAVLGVMARAGVERLVCAGNGHHMIDLDNPIAHMTGYRSVGPALLVIEADGAMRLLTSPADEADVIEALCSPPTGAAAVALGHFAPVPPTGAARHLPRVEPEARLRRDGGGKEFALRLNDTRAVDDIGAAAKDFLGGSKRTAVVGLDAMPRRLAATIEAALGGAEGKLLDDAFYAATAAKTDDEIADARRATEIAEAGYKRLLEIVRPGIAECDLAIELNLYMRELGANDSFLMLNCGPRQDAVMPSSERRIEAGDLLLCELSPSVKGQFTQICRTVSIGPALDITAQKYPLLVAAMREGIARVRPGVRLGDVCAAIDDNLSAAGYAKFSRPPFIRRRGHGLGCGSTAPGDVSVDNETVLEPGMLFMVHPNQFLPETGYMMCGEPVLVTETGHEVLTRDQAALTSTDGRLG